MAFKYIKTKTKKGFRRVNFKDMKKFKQEYKKTKKKNRNAIIWTKKTRKTQIPYRTRKTQNKRQKLDKLIWKKRLEESIQQEEFKKQHRQEYENQYNAAIRRTRNFPKASDIQYSLPTQKEPIGKEFIDHVPDEQESEELYRGWLSKIVLDEDIKRRIIIHADEFLKHRITGWFSFLDEKTGVTLGTIMFADLLPPKMRGFAEEVMAEIDQLQMEGKTLRFTDVMGKIRQIVVRYKENANAEDVEKHLDGLVNHRVGSYKVRFDFA